MCLHYLRASCIDYHSFDLKCLIIIQSWVVAIIIVISDYLICKIVITHLITSFRTCFFVGFMVYTFKLWHNVYNDNWVKQDKVYQKSKLKNTFEID